MLQQTHHIGLFELKTANKINEFDIDYSNNTLKIINDYLFTYKSERSGVSKITIYNIRSKEELGTYSVKGLVVSIGLSDNHKFLFVIDSQKKLSVFSLEYKQLDKSFMILDDFNMFQESEDCIQAVKFTWTYDFPGWSDWDERGRKYLDSFLKKYPKFSESDLTGLFADLQKFDLGWIREDGIRRRLVELSDRESNVQALSDSVRNALKDGDIIRAKQEFDEMCKIQRFKGSILYCQLNSEISKFCQAHILESVTPNTLLNNCGLKFKSASFSDDSQYLFLIDSDKKRYKYCFKTYTLYKYNVLPSFGLLSPDGIKLIIDEPNEDMKVINTHTLKMIASIADKHRFGALKVFNHDGKMLLSTTDKDASLNLWSTETGHLIMSYTGLSGRASQLGFSKDEKSIVVSNNNGVKFINIKTGTLERSLEINKVRKQYFDFSPDGKTILTYSKTESLNRPLEFDTTIALWRTSNLSFIKKFDIALVYQHHKTKLTGELGIDSVRFSNDGRYIIQSDNNYGMNIIETESGTCGMPIKLNRQTFNSISPNGNCMITSENNNLKFYFMNWNYTLHDWADWNEGARPYLDNFLALYPKYTNNDFHRLITDLQNKGYGWIRPEGVRAKLEEIAKQRR